MLLLYSDGVTEARNGDGAVFGDERLAQVLEREHADAEAMMVAVLGAVESFVNGAEPYDDVTVVAVGWRGEGGA